MAKRRSFTPEQIVMKLREVEVLLCQGKTIKAACKVLEVNEQTYYRRRRENGGMNVSEAKRLKELEKENAQLKKLVADLSLDNAIIKEVLKKSDCAREQTPGGRIGH